ncbi:hypothetical protein [Methanococcoides sp. LMO-2]|uniref:Uncharacterized protein n=1 Tax=Methanococcoides cohabitans TaxID=3136559 RepID=A0ABU9KVU1_9EURY
MSENVEFNQHAKFIEYLEKIGIGDTLQKKINYIYDFYREVCNEEIKDIFINEYLTEDGERVYENLFLFSDTFIMEAKNIMKEDDFDMTPLKNRITYWQIRKVEYDFIESNEKSRMYLQVLFDKKIEGAFKASKENCDALKNIIMTYIVTNLQTE